MSTYSREKLTAMALVAFLAAASGGACTNKEEAGKPSSVPPLDPATAQGAPAAAPSAPPAAAPTLAMPAASPPAEEPPAADPGASITGSIVLAPAVAKAKPKGGTLYLVARRISDNPTARGTLIAVRKLPATKFPLPFSLTAADMPFQNGPFDGDLVLTARIDQDGDPLTHEKGDVYGSLPKVPVGSHDVKLALDQVQKETESLAGGAPIMGGMGAPGSAGAMPPGHPQMGGAALPPGHP
ncbi:MAG TPA: hypothetical protein VLC06_27175 [Polyangia bacterium]|jgi:hypothetical protein|nr:hypothetical protein [Polyangia bacterium]